MSTEEQGNSNGSTAARSASLKCLFFTQVWTVRSPHSHDSLPRLPDSIFILPVHQSSTVLATTPASVRLGPIYRGAKAGDSGPKV